MIYFFYFASFLFTPIQQLFDAGTILLVTFNLLIVIYGCIIYFKTGNTITDAIQASMLATLSLQLCSMFSHVDIIASVNHPVYAFIVISYLSTLHAMKHSTHLNTPVAAGASVLALIAIGISLPGSVLSAVLSFS